MRDAEPARLVEPGMGIFQLVEDAVRATPIDEKQRIPRPV